MRVFVSNFIDFGLAQRLNLTAAIVVLLGGLLLGSGFAAAADNRDTLVLRGYVPERAEVDMQVAEDNGSGELARITMRSNSKTGAELRLESASGKLPENLTLDGRPIAADRRAVRLGDSGGVLAVSDREGPKAQAAPVTLVVSAR